MTDHVYYLFTGASLVLCLAIMYICIRRQKASSKAVLRRVRWSHAVMGTGAFCLGFGPLYSIWAGVMLFEAGVLVALLCDSYRWTQNEPPNDALTEPAPLGEQ